MAISQFDAMYLSLRADGYIELSREWKIHPQEATGVTRNWVCEDTIIKNEEWLRYLKPQLARIQMYRTLQAFFFSRIYLQQMQKYFFLISLMSEVSQTPRSASVHHKESSTLVHITREAKGKRGLNNYLWRNKQEHADG